MTTTSFNSPVLMAALSYLERGWSVLPCVGKRPALPSWSALQVARPPMSHLHEWHKRGLLQNVGVICGAVSDNLVVIDLDGTKAVDEFDRQFPHLFETRVIMSGSGAGKHLYLRCKSLPPTTRTSGTPFGGFELRADGCYVVAPPSIHPETNMLYVRIGDEQPLEVDNLDDVVTFIRSFQKDRQPMPSQPGNTQARRSGWRTRQAMYFERALDGEQRRVLSSQEGVNRNDNLNKAAFYLGKLVPSGLDRAEVEDKLLAAALAVGLGEVESRRTIKSGLDAGIRKARGIPDMERENG